MNLNLSFYFSSEVNPPLNFASSVQKLLLTHLRDLGLSLPGEFQADSLVDESSFASFAKNLLRVEHDVADPQGAVVELYGRGCHRSVQSRGRRIRPPPVAGA